MKNGTTREVEFKNNKVNVITGDSQTGKSAILDIIDYCLLSSSSNISEDTINENVVWYGISFNINKQNLVIARKAPQNNKVSKELFFTSDGTIPNLPVININEITLKSYLNSQFGINCDVKMPYGGSTIKSDSKISFRFFLMFNTQSQDVIDNSTIFFDKQHENHYREALSRIFDLAVGVDTIENILFREQKADFEQELLKLEKKKELFDKKKIEFKNEIYSVIRQAKEYNLINEDLVGNEAIEKLKEVVSNVDNVLSNNMNLEYNTLVKQSADLKRKIHNIEVFIDDYNKYKDTMNKILEGFKPIDYLTRVDADILKTSAYEKVIDVLKNDFKTIKSSISDETPISVETHDLLISYNKELANVESKISKMPETIHFFKNDAEKYVFIGLIRSKLDLYLTNDDKSDYDKQIKEKTKLYDAIIVKDISEERKNFIDVLEDIIEVYIKQVSEALENYSNYLPSFNYSRKMLNLRKPMSQHYENVGSSSNHMFLHLLLFTSLHNYIVKQNIPFVPSFLILDQFSRPYWGENNESGNNLKHTDRFKVSKAIELLNRFIDDVKENGNDFQIILFEHIEKEMFKDMQNFHLVEEFNNGNALIQSKNIEVNEIKLLQPS